MNQDFTNFLKYASSQKQASLIIAKDERELNEFLGVLGQEGFKNADTVRDLLNLSDTETKTCYVIRSKLPKDVYDFIIQYPTGQVEISDEKGLNRQVVSPKYQGSSFVVLTLLETLRRTEERGFSLLESCGLAYQTVV